MLFHVVLGACAVEDACTGFVSIINLGLLLAVSLMTFFTQNLPAHGMIRHGAGAILLCGPFVVVAARDRAGWADPVGVLAIGLRFPFLRSCTILAAACALGLVGAKTLPGSLSIAASRRGNRTPRTVPFFPGLALAALIVGCLAALPGGWL
jgi:hypothetical protein